MKSIVIIGSNLIGLLCADILSKENKVIIIEADLELGFPASFPGKAAKHSTISNILSGQTEDNLFLKSIDDTVNFRSEWFSKLLTHKLAKNNVKIMNRSRVSSINETSDLLDITTQGSDNNQNNFMCDIVIDFSAASFSNIGGKQHEYNSTSSKIIQPQITTKEYFVGVCILKDSNHLQNFETKNHRNDNLVEIWFESGKQQQPKQGWIESKIVNAYSNDKLMLLEDYHLKAIEITENLVIL